MSVRAYMVVVGAALTLGAMLGISGGLSSAGTGLAAASAMPGPYAQVITVDGVQVEVSVQVIRLDAAAAPQSRPQTSVSVTLKTTDGSNLPAHLGASVVKLDRARPPSRMFRQPLLPVLTFRFDPTTSGYEAIGTPAYQAGAVLKATIRLETSTGVRYVRFNRVQVAG